MGATVDDDILAEADRLVRLEVARSIKLSKATAKAESAAWKVDQMRDAGWSPEALAVLEAECAAARAAEHSLRTEIASAAESARAVPGDRGDKLRGQMMFHRWATSPTAGGCAPGASPLSRFEELLYRVNWDGVIIAHELAFGELHMRDKSPQQSSAAGELIRLLDGIVRGGPKYISEWCLRRRQRCCGIKPARLPRGAESFQGSMWQEYGRGVSSRRLFLASTLDRQFTHRATPEEMATALEEAFDRLTQPKETSALVADVAHFARGLVKKSTRKIADSYPVPRANESATFENPRRVGGQKDAVDLWLENARGIGRPVNPFRHMLWVSSASSRVVFDARGREEYHRTLGPPLAARGADWLVAYVPTHRDDERLTEEEFNIRSEQIRTGTYFPNGRKYEFDDARHSCGRFRLQLCSAAMRQMALRRKMARLAEEIDQGDRRLMRYWQAYTDILADVHMPAAPAWQLTERDRAIVEHRNHNLSLHLQRLIETQRLLALDHRRGMQLANDIWWSVTSAFPGMFLPRAQAKFLGHDHWAHCYLRERVCTPAAVQRRALRGIRTIASRENARSVCRLTAFANTAGKLRLATVHEASVTITARGQSQALLQGLRNIKTNSRMLRNQRIEISQESERSVVYSADWSKATDWIDREMAIRVVEAALQELGADPALVKATMYTCSQMDVMVDFEDTSPVTGRPIGVFRERTPLTTGALMGLGPSWFVLGVLNDYCATRAGASPDTYQVNGDDLIACWNPSTIDRYERLVGEVKLKLNKLKSFRGHHGVFCEQLVERTPTGARGTVEFRLGESSGACSSAADRGHYVLDDLRDIHSGRHGPNGRPAHRLCQLLARRAAARHPVTRKLPGRLAHGGGGLGQANAATLCVFLTGGPVSLRTKAKTVREQRRSAASRNVVRKLPSVPGDAPRGAKRIDEALTDLAVRAAEADDVLFKDWRARARAKPADLRAHAKRLECRLRTAVPSGSADSAQWQRHLASDDAKARYSSVGRAKAWNQCRHKRFEKAIIILKKHPRLIDAEALSAQLGPPIFPQEARNALRVRTLPVGET